MIINALNNITEQESIGVLDEIEAGIDSSSMPFLFEMMSNNLYSNPIGSLIREYTSNCFDAQVDVNPNEPIIINLLFDVENNGWYIEFCDNGIGLSKEGIQNVFMNYFSSTKRQSNTAIGGFGLGSKSGLAYQDYFYITTRYNGIKYQYLFHKGTDRPKIELLNTSETAERNGTVIRIDIKNSDDYLRFVDEINKQLSYFDGVFINAKDEHRFDNNYKILETETFKFRTGREYSSYAHVVIDQVAYPIDWEQIKENRYNVPIGIKFAIGELDVTPNREQLRYTDRTIALIKERLKLAKEEIAKIYEKQNPDPTDLDTFIKVRGKSRYITLGEYKLHIGGSREDKKFSLFPELTMPYDLFFDYTLLRITNGKIAPKEESVTEQYIHHYYFTEKLDKFNTLHIGEGSVIVPRKRSYYEYCKIFGIWGNKKQPVGKAKLIYKWKQYIREYIKQNAQQYNTVTQEWIKEWKEEHTSKIVKDKTVIEYYNYAGSNIKKTTVQELSKYLLVFCIPYSDRTDHNVSEYEYILSKWKAVDKIKFIIITKGTEKMLSKLENTRHIEDFYTTKEFQRYFDKLLLARHLTAVNLYRIKYSNYYDKIAKALKEFKDEWYNEKAYSLADKQIPQSTSNWFVRSKLKELLKFQKAADILTYIDMYKMPEKYVKKIMKLIKITKLNFPL